MSAKEYNDEINQSYMVGVVEFTNDEKRLGRVKVRVERLHGRKTDNNFIPTEDLPWCNVSIRGTEFGYPSIDKVVEVEYINGDYYNGEVVKILHYNINLQDKLDSLDDSKYKDFYSSHFDDKHQYYHDKDIGIMFDYVKSNLNFKPNGDIKLNLRDNKSNLFLGTEDADQQAILGNHFMNWVNKLVQHLMGSQGGPYFGNLGAPVLPSPTFLSLLNEYLAIEHTFLSDRVFIVDDNKVKPQDREYDISQIGDNYNDENFNKVNKPKEKGHTPEKRPEGGGNPDGVPPTNFSENLSTSKSSPNDTDKLRNVKPFDGYGNGELPIDSLTISKELQLHFSSDGDERKYLLDAPAKSLDSFFDLYKKERNKNWTQLMATKGYHSLDRQTNTKNQYPAKSPEIGHDPFGFANQVEIYFGVNKSNRAMTTALKKFIRDGVNRKDFIEVDILEWLIENGKKFKWRIAGKTSTNDEQWWHWIYDPSIIDDKNSNTPVGEEDDTSNAIPSSDFNYEFVKVGAKTNIKVYKINDVIYDGVPTFSYSEDVLINEAKEALFDEHGSSVKSMIKRNGVDETTDNEYVEDDNSNDTTNPLLIDKFNYFGDDEFTDDSQNSISVSIMDKDLWNIDIIEYSNSLASGTVAYINNDKKSATIDMVDFIKNEMGIESGEIDGSLETFFTIIVNPIGKNKRTQYIESIKAITKLK